MTKKICFVIQPFSDTYDKRFENVYKPAIENIGLVPYRTGGHSVDDIPEDIRRRIREAHICFADITEDSPNVWYEVGFAHACNRQVVMVCDEEVRIPEDLPFDISVRNVLFYKGKEVNSDKFYRNGFIKDITDRAKARSDEADSGSNSPATTQQSLNSDYFLTPFCSKILKMIFKHCFEDEYIMVIRDIISGFPDIEEERVMLALHKLETDGFITRGKLPNYVTGEGSGYHLTDKGNQWISNNPD